MTETLTDKQKLDEVIRSLAEEHLIDHCLSCDHAWIGDTFAMAGLNHDGAPLLTIYTRADLLAMYLDETEYE